MSDREILEASALEQAEWVRSRKISSAELVRFYLRRIQAHDGKLQAFVHLLERAAVREAERKDRTAVPSSPFFGVPIGIKDLNFVKGSFTRFGSRTFKWLWTPFDDRMVAQLRRGGFVILGKLSTSELGALPMTEPPIHAPTRNPWNLDYTPGGSSGGSAAAVAAGLLPIAQGSDGAGSIRIPSSFCHLFGFKPSRGVIPNGRNDPRKLAVSGPIARSVDDAAAMLDVMAGLSVPIEKHVPASARPYAQLAREKPRRLRIRMTLSNTMSTPEPEIVEAVQRVARALEELGHHVEAGGPPDGSLEEFLPLWQRAIGAVPLPRRWLGPIPRWLVEAGRRLSPEAVRACHDQLAARIGAWFGDADLWLTPTVARSPPRIGELDAPDPRVAFEAAAVLGAYTAMFNLTGQPASSIPVGLTRQGLPIGAQLAGRALEDGTVLAVSRELEEIMPWKGRTAPFASG